MITLSSQLLLIFGHQSEVRDNTPNEQEQYHVCQDNRMAYTVIRLVLRAIDV